MSEDIEVTPKDALQVAQRALAKANEQERRINDLEEQLEDAETELTRQALRLSEYDDERPYDQLTRDDKVGMVREHAFRKATRESGRTALDYKAVRWEVFDGEPGAKHCYTLMKLAAGFDETTAESSVPGFRYRTPSEESNNLAVDATEARKHRERFFPENKAAQEGDA